MKYIKLDSAHTKRAASKVAADYLLSGKIVLSPSDTVYGLSVRADKALAIKKLREFKGRGDNKPLLILISSLAMLKKYFYITTPQAQYLKKVWFESTRPTTVILHDRKLLPRDLNSQENGLAVRLPKSDFLIKIIRCLKVPLVSTSANLTGLEPISDPANITQLLGLKQPQLIIDGGASRKVKSSKLIDLRDYPQIKILRK
ncbi:hypothetical protein COT98_02270 [Candidatus Falkowbacteria bacterium CG10_big_fil_rev_8_21_14_0_10_39_9]|uniref:L-threonylcarbamoyladenylate synthase n=1 Tax=Candidatus Falkowbacteria bacterium CG10_big_fil_rev_8_21_14_0_10_39_9 TaxID=1974566 RepID=A0A2M6WPM3_9BACT|nr:MAG: hypothetical protein COT98_02270 [Candidatus Falkowbacteria bacterium CG10_big_fil_rev_8_21_14_0_10_39_9]